MWRSDRQFLLHWTAEGRAGVCTDDDPNPPPEDRIIARLSHEHFLGLMDDGDEVLQWCRWRDGLEPEDD